MTTKNLMEYNLALSTAESAVLMALLASRSTATEEVISQLRKMLTPQQWEEAARKLETVASDYEMAHDAAKMIRAQIIT